MQKFIDLLVTGLPWEWENIRPYENPGKFFDKFPCVFLWPRRRPVPIICSLFLASDIKVPTRLTVQQKIEAWKMHDGGGSQRDVANRFSTGKETINSIKRFRNNFEDLKDDERK